MTSKIGAKAQRIQANQDKTVSLSEFWVSDDLSARLHNVLEQTGVSIQNLLQKWLLQEEQEIEFALRREEHFLKALESRLNANLPTISQPKPSQTAPIEFKDEADYRERILARIRKLKKVGMGNTDIAKLFNTENMRTLKGKGKWYPSSVAWLVKLK